MTKANRVPSPVVLTDTQRQLCLAALCRPDGAITMPARLKGRPATNVVEALIGKSLVREIRTKADLPVWRLETGTGHRFSLVLTKAARTLLGAEGAAAAAVPVEAPAVADALLAPKAPTSVTALGTLELPPENDAATEVLVTDPQPAGTEPVSPRSGSKLSGVIALLGRDAGTSVADIMDATGWLPHTTRAALTGLRKRGYPVLREAAADGAGSVYRLGPAATIPDAEQAATAAAA